MFNWRIWRWIFKWKKNGKGKDYHCEGKIEFEGEYLNDKRNGKGKEYDEEGNLIFEGEYLNDKKWNGKGYDKSNNEVYELNDGKGLIKVYYIDTGRFAFEGEYLNGKRNGKGKEYWNDELEFEGEYLNGIRKKIDNT